MSLRITFGPWGETLGELVAAGQAAEAAGAEVLWTPEIQRSAIVPAAALAVATRTARIGTAIALAFTRSPMTHALEVLDVDELSGGRLIYGLGTGVQRLNEDWHNARFGKAAPHLRETIRNIREFWRCAGSGAAIELAGEYEPMRIRGYQRPFHQERESVPIYLAAMGPVMMRLAGEIGDGWISHELASPAHLTAHAWPHLRDGLQRAGRARADLDVVVSALCAIDDDRQLARRWAAGTVGFYASVRTYADFFAFHDAVEGQQRVIDAFRSGRRADDLGEFVDDAMVDAVTLAGTVDDVVARLGAYDGVADSVKLTPPAHGVSPEVTRRCQEQIIELIRILSRG